MMFEWATIGAVLAASCAGVVLKRVRHERARLDAMLRLRPHRPPVEPDRGGVPGHKGVSFVLVVGLLALMVFQPRLLAWGIGGGVVGVAAAIWKGTGAAAARMRSASPKI